MTTIIKSVADDDKRHVEHEIEHMYTIKEEQPIGPTETFKNENETAISAEAENSGVKESLLKTPETDKTRESKHVESPSY